MHIKAILCFYWWTGLSIIITYITKYFFLTAVCKHTLYGGVTVVDKNMTKKLFYLLTTTLQCDIYHFFGADTQLFNLLLSVNEALPCAQWIVGRFTCSGRTRLPGWRFDCCWDISLTPEHPDHAPSNARCWPPRPSYTYTHTHTHTHTHKHKHTE